MLTVGPILKVATILRALTASGSASAVKRNQLLIVIKAKLVQSDHWKNPMLTVKRHRHTLLYYIAHRHTSLYYST